MKKMMMLAMAIVMTLSASAARTRVETAPFYKVNINFTAHVKVALGHGFGLDVRSQDGKAVEGVRWNVEDGILKINTTDLATLEQKNGELEVTVISPFEPALTVGQSLAKTDEQVTFPMPDKMPQMMHMHRHMWARR